jgi:transposase
VAKKKIVAPKLSVDEAVSRLREMHERGDTDAMFAAMLELLTKLAFDNAKLSADNARLLKRALGQTSERVGSKQLDMLMQLVDAPKDEHLAAPSPEPEPEGGKRGKGKQKNRDNHGRRALPAHLPRIENIVHVEGDARNCPICGKERTCIGHAMSETLEYSPASFKVLVNKSEKLACKDHEEAGVVTAPAAVKGIDKGIPGPGLLAHVVVLKFADHVGLHHIRAMLLREQIDIPVSTLVGWIRAAHDALVPIADRIHALAFVSHVLHADDTGLKVLDEGSPGGAYRGRMWGMVGDRRWASYCFKPSSEAKHANGLLAARRGYLAVDAHGNYDGLFKIGEAIEVGCWCHARRPFVEALEQGDTRCAVIVKLVKGLYEVEHEATALGSTTTRVGRFASRSRSRSSMRFALGRKSSSHSSRLGASTAARATTSSSTRRRCIASSTTARCRWTTTRRSERCAASPKAGNRGSSPGATPAPSGQRRCAPF